MTIDDVVARFCALQVLVAKHLKNWVDAADCFCRDPSRGGVSDDPADYRNDGVALEWIERAVEEKIAREKGAPDPGTVVGGSPPPTSPGPATPLALPCPFCGGEPEIGPMGENTQYVTCRECRTEGPFGPMDRDAAIERWNQRTGAVGPGGPVSRPSATQTEKAV